MYYSNTGDELKAFSIKDGLGIKLLQKAGVQVAIITGREAADWVSGRNLSELIVENLYVPPPL